MSCPNLTADMSAYQRQYRAEHREERRQKAHEYHLAHKEQIKASAASYRAKHRQELRNKRNAISAFLAQYKMEKGCCDCGYRKHPTALQFDHLRDKKITVGQATSIARAKVEIEKCVVRCANCHAIRHHGQHQKEAC